jgi:hypothetical protein
VTASQFADAVNLGYGSSKDFLAHVKSRRQPEEQAIDDAKQESSLRSSPERVMLSSSQPSSPVRLQRRLSQSSSPSASPTSRYTSHGVESEPVILEMYELLTGHVVRPAGLFVCEQDQRLAYLVGASPDGLILDPSGQAIGLVEIKAPTRRLYSADTAHCIPAGYMCQMQGQMGVARVPTFCDFVTVCFATRELRVQRVHFSTAYWRTLESQLLKYSCLPSC